MTLTTYMELPVRFNNSWLKGLMTLSKVDFKKFLYSHKFLDFIYHFQWRQSTSLAQPSKTFEQRYAMLICIMNAAS